MEKINRELLSIKLVDTAQALLDFGNNYVFFRDESYSIVPDVEQCNKCKSAGFPIQLIGFEKICEDLVTCKDIWKLLNEDSTEHKQRTQSTEQSYQNSSPNLEHPGTTIVDTKERMLAEILLKLDRMERKLA